LVIAHILSVANVGINILVRIKFVQNVIISWVTQNLSICFTMVEHLDITTPKRNGSNPVLLLLFLTMKIFIMTSHPNDLFHHGTTMDE